MSKTIGLKDPALVKFLGRKEKLEECIKSLVGLCGAYGFEYEDLINEELIKELVWRVNSDVSDRVHAMYLEAGDD